MALKQNVAPITDGLSKVLALRPVVWKWKDKSVSSKLQQGFIAQEVANILPHLVEDGKWHDKSTRKFLYANGIVPYLVRAISEQQQQIATLEHRLAKLEQFVIKSRTSKQKS